MGWVKITDSTLLSIMLSNFTIKLSYIASSYATLLLLISSCLSYITFSDLTYTYSHPILSHPILSCLVLSYLILSYLILSYLSS